jgi:PAS domain S-box-containing protein
MSVRVYNGHAISDLIGRAGFDQAPSGLLLLSTDGVVLAANRAAIQLLGDPPDPIVGRVMWDVIATVGTPQHAAWIRRAIANASDPESTAAPFENEIDERERTTAWAVRPVATTNGTVGALVVEARDVTTVHRTNTETRLLVDLALALTQTDSLDLALTVALQTVCEAAGWSVGEAWVADQTAPGEVRLARAAVWTMPERRLQVFIAQGSGFHFSPGEGLPGVAWQRREPVWESPLTGTGKFTRASLASAAGLRAAVAIPILARGEPVAVMSCYMTEPRAQDIRLTRVAVAVASQVGPLLQQKKAEEAHRNAEAQLAGTVAIATDAIISIDDARRISLFNWGAERIFGYTSEEAVGQSLDMLLPEELRHLHAGEIAHFATSAQTARRMGERSTIVGRRKNGEIFPAEASISRYMAGGRWTFTVIMQDITDRRRTEDGLRFLAEVGALLAELLQDQMALQRAAARAVPTLGDVCVIDLVENDHILTAAVASCDSTLARAIQEFRDRIPLRWDVKTPAIEAMQHRRTLLLPDGLGDGPSDTPWVDSSRDAARALKLRSLLIVPLVAHDHVLGAVSFAMTAGGRRHDASYRALAEEFAVRIASAVDNAALYQRTRQAVGARDETLAVVSHDLRNPLSAVAMCVSALRETPPPSAETMADLLGSVQESTTLMSRIIQDLLDVASIDAGRLSLDRRLVSLRPVLEHAEAMFRGVADEHGIALVLEHAALDALPKPDIDAERILQVLGNLLHNAVKFTDPGGIVRISSAAPAGKVIVAVSDTGPGISPEDLPHIFDRFWHGRRRTKIRSTGLGLAISRGIIHAHGGRIWAESTLGHGTAVSFELPVAPPANS